MTRSPKAKEGEGSRVWCRYQPESNRPTYPPVQRACEEVTAHFLPQVVPNHVEGIGLRFAHASSDASRLFSPEVAYDTWRDT